MDRSRRHFLASLGALLTPLPLRAAPAPWFGAFTDIGASHGFEELTVTGRLPDDLKGTLYRNGAMALMAPDGQRYEHWFDGDGGVIAVRFDGRGGARGSVRLLESAGLRAERARGKRLHLGYGSTVDRPLWKLLGGKLKNVANTNVIPWGEELLALVDSCPPSRVDPETLALLGAEDFGGRIKGGFSAHPHRVHGDPRLINTGMHYARKPILRLYEMTPGGMPRVLFEQRDPHSALVHDFGLTATAAVLLLPPLGLTTREVIAGGGALSAGLRWQPERGTQVMIVPLDHPDHPIRVTLDPFFQWHIANAFDRGGEIALDLVRYPDFDNNRAIGDLITGRGNNGDIDGRLSRLVIDRRTGQHQMDIVGERTGEFPQVSPRTWGRPHRYVYLTEHSTDAVARAGMPDGLTRYDMETGRSLRLPRGAGTYPGEPLVIPKTGVDAETAVWVISMVYNSATDRSGVLVYDGERLSRGPVASAWFSGPRHVTFHGSWVPA